MLGVAGPRRALRDAGVVGPCWARPVRYERMRKRAAAAWPKTKAAEKSVVRT